MKKVEPINGHRLKNNEQELKNYELACQYREDTDYMFDGAILGVNEMGSPKEYLTEREKNR